MARRSCRPFTRSGASAPWSERRWVEWSRRPGSLRFPHFATAALLFGIATVGFAFSRLLEAGEAKVPASPAEDRPRKLMWPPRRLLALGAVAFCIMLGEGAMADWSAIFLRDSARAGEAMAAAGYAAFSLTMAATRFSGDTLSARFGAATLVRAGSALAAIGLALALIVGQPIVALVGFAAVGAGFATIVPQVFSGRRPHPRRGRRAGARDGHDDRLLRLPDRPTADRLRRRAPGDCAPRSASWSP